MGYDQRFALSITVHDPALAGEMTPAKLLRRLRRRSEGAEVALNERGDPENPVDVWWEYTEDLDAFSGKYPGFLFQLTGVGEGVRPNRPYESKPDRDEDEEEDEETMPDGPVDGYVDPVVWVMYFLGGKHYYQRIMATIPPFDLTRLGAEASLSALSVWQILLAGFKFQPEFPPETVATCLVNRSLADRIVFQLALRGTGYHTRNFNPNGVVDDETLESLKLLYEAAQYRDADSE